MTETTTIILAIVAIFPASLAAILSYMTLIRNKETHDLVNSRMTELLEITKSASRAEGVIEGKEKK